MAVVRFPAHRSLAVALGSTKGVPISRLKGFAPVRVSTGHLVSVTMTARVAVVTAPAAQFAV
jgi:hypothetical protein